NKRGKLITAYHFALQEGTIFLIASTTAAWLIALLAVANININYTKYNKKTTLNLRNSDSKFCMHDDERTPVLKLVPQQSITYSRMIIMGFLLLLFKRIYAWIASTATVRGEHADEDSWPTSWLAVLAIVLGLDVEEEHVTITHLPPEGTCKEREGGGQSSLCVNEVL
ncbi:hypothetical protein ACJX0J_018375, partial [Zea mays]